MTVGIGCDIVEHNLTRKLKWSSDEEILRRLLSPDELTFYNKSKPVSFLAGRFAAKEAVLKCIGTGMQDEISLIDIKILQNDYSKPGVVLSGKAKIIADKLGINAWHLSITHSQKYSLAFVVAEKREKK